MALQLTTEAELVPPSAEALIDTKLRQGHLGTVDRFVIRPNHPPLLVTAPRSKVQSLRWCAGVWKAVQP
jgi:hypothetical protein